MTGTAKQVKWAEAIKAQFLAHQFGRIPADAPAEQAAIVKQALDTVTGRHTDAGWWIDNRCTLSAGLPCTEIAEEYKAEATRLMA